jgi:hypothetical protein
MVRPKRFELLPFIAKTLSGDLPFDNDLPSPLFS